MGYECRNAEPASTRSRSELERILSTLVGRIDELESELSRERARCRVLGKRVGKQEDRYGLILDDIFALEDAVDEFSGPTGDILPPENALPIMRLTWSYEATPDALRPNERRAAIVWKHFFDVFSKTPTKYVLDSNDVGTVASQDDPVNRDPVTGFDLFAGLVLVVSLVTIVAGYLSLSEVYAWYRGP